MSINTYGQQYLIECIRNITWLLQQQHFCKVLYLCWFLFQ